MWLHFMFQVLLALMLLYGLGLPLTCLFPQLDRIRWGCAPLASLLVLSLLANVYVLIGFHAGWMGLVVPITLVGVAALAVRARSGSVVRSFSADMALYLVIAIAVAVIYYVKPLDGAASFAQGYDNGSHLATVRGYLDSGIFADGSITYPEAWRTLTALVASFDGGLVTVAANAVNFVIIAFVAPLSICSFLSVVSDKRLVVVSGAVIAVAFQAFPWAYLYFGPLYPNLLGYSLLPAVLSLFVLMTRAETGRSFVSHLVLFVMGCVTLMFAHASAIFTGIVLIFPYGVWATHLRVKQTTGNKALPFVAVSAFILLVLGVWTVCFRSPMFANVVMFNWPSLSSGSQAVGNILSLALNRVSAQQLVLSALVFVGIASCILRHSNRWMVASWCLACLIYFVDITREGWLKHYLAGFWYTDSFRVAAVVAMSCIPLAALGFSVVTEAALRVIDEADKKKAWLAIAAASALLVYCPSLPMVRSTSSSVESESMTTAFGMTYEQLSKYYSLANGESTFDAEEVAFAAQVKGIVGDAKVLNFPYDGSLFAYGVSGLNVCNRTWGGYEGSTADMSLINTGVNRVAFDDDVKKALDNEGIRYLVLFDYGNETGQGLNYTEYNPDCWTGVEGVTDQTNGFTLLLSNGDMRLYRIDPIED